MNTTRGKRLSSGLFVLGTVTAAVACLLAAAAGFAQPFQPPGGPGPGGGGPAGLSPQLLEGSIVGKTASSIIIRTAEEGEKTIKVTARTQYVTHIPIGREMLSRGDTVTLIGRKSPEGSFRAMIIEQLSDDVLKTRTQPFPPGEAGDREKKYASRKFPPSGRERGPGPIRGTITSLDPLKVRPDSGGELEVELTPRTRIVTVEAASPSDLTEGRNVRVIAPADEAVMVVILPAVAPTVPEETSTPPSPADHALPLLEHSRDADGIIWGTEARGIIPGLSPDPEKIVGIVNDILKTRHVKFRLSQAAVTRDGAFTTDVLVPSPRRPTHRFNLDQVVETYRRNGWSMIPMLSHVPRSDYSSDAEIEEYVNFVDWFVGRYREAASIEYVQLINAPYYTWRGTDARLLELSNRAYDRLKSNYPEILVGTPGFEYAPDRPEESKAVRQVEYFLDKENDARFDFWAFHGYVAKGGTRESSVIYPPQKTPVHNPYSGVPGILEIRRRLDANGWEDRGIWDMEHTGIIRARKLFTEEEDRLNAAYMVQQLVLKRCLKLDQRFVLDGIFPLKVLPRRMMEGEPFWGCLPEDGSPGVTVRAVGLLLSLFNSYRHDSRVSGAFDRDDLVWIEKFVAPGRELYIFFKPFTPTEGPLADDGKMLFASLSLEEEPVSVTLTDCYGTRREIIPPSRTIVLPAVNAPGYLEVQYSGDGPGPDVREGGATEDG